MKALAKQCFRTGRWRRHVIREYPETAGLRYLAPPAAVIGLTVGTVVGAIGSVVPGAPAWLKLGWAAPVAYGALVLGGSIMAGRELNSAAKLRLPGVIATMHVSWGAGFLLPAGKDRPQSH